MRSLFALSLLTFACRKDDKSGPEDFEIADVEDPGTPLDSGQDTGEADTGEGGDTGEADTGEDTEATDARTFGMLQVISMLLTDPGPFTEDQEATVTTSWVLARWERRGTDLTWTETLCGLESTEVFDTTTSFPDAFVETMPVRTRTGTLSEAATGAELVAGPFYDVVGAALDDPQDDPLPTDPDDPSVFDQDEDGNPGVTVHIDQAWLGEGDAYVAQRNTTTYEGVVVATDRVEGYLDATTEQVILAASAWWLELESAPPEPDPEESHSYFVMQQMEDGSGCQDVLEQRDSLF